MSAAISSQRIMILLLEYEQTQIRKRKYLKILIQTVLAYILMTGLIINYVLGTTGLSIIIFLVATADVMFGALGAFVMFTAMKSFTQSEQRLETLCSKLKIYYEGSSEITAVVWSIYISYVIVLGLWGYIILERTILELLG